MTYNNYRFVLDGSDGSASSLALSPATPAVTTAVITLTPGAAALSLSPAAPLLALSPAIPATQPPKHALAAAAWPVMFVRSGERGPARVVRLKAIAIPAKQPDELAPADAEKIVRQLSAETKNIVVIPYGEKRAAQRRITRRQIELCVQKGTIVEGPFVINHGQWQMNLFRHAAGEEITCVVAIEWATKVLVINAF